MAQRVVLHRLWDLKACCLAILQLQKGRGAAAARRRQQLGVSARSGTSEACNEAAKSLRRARKAAQGFRRRYEAQGGFAALNRIATYRDDIDQPH